MNLILYVRLHVYKLAGLVRELGYIPWTGETTVIGSGLWVYTLNWIEDKFGAKKLRRNQFCFLANLIKIKLGENHLTLTERRERDHVPEPVEPKQLKSVYWVLEKAAKGETKL